MEAKNAIDLTDPECNAGFIRQMQCFVVLVSDEREQSDDLSGETWQQLSDQIIAKRVPLVWSNFFYCWRCS